VSIQEQADDLILRECFAGEQRRMDAAHRVHVGELHRDLWRSQHLDQMAWHLYEMTRAEGQCWYTVPRSQRAVYRAACEKLVKEMK